MATAATQVGYAPSLHTRETPAGPVSPAHMNCINDFIIHQAQSIPDTPLISYPRSELGASDFADYTAKDLDNFADEAARVLTSQGLKPTVRSPMHALYPSRLQN